MPRIEHPVSLLVPRLRGLHLFHFEGAPCAQRVRLALAEKGFARGREVAWSSDADTTLAADPGTWTSRHVSLVRKQHLTPAYAAIHPNMVVPALVHDGWLYLESMDIVAYLDELVPANPLIPADPERRRLAEDLVADGKRLHVSLRFVSFRWGLGRLGRLGAKEEEALRRLEPAGSPEKMFDFYSRYDDGRIDESTYLAHLAGLEQGFARLEALLGDGRAFLTGDSLTVADVLWALKVLRLTECGYPFAPRFPHVETWFARMRARPSFRSGVMQRHRLLSGAFRWKAAVENFFGAGLGAVGGGSPAAAR